MHCTVYQCVFVLYTHCIVYTPQLVSDNESPSSSLKLNIFLLASLTRAAITSIVSPTSTWIQLVAFRFHSTLLQLVCSLHTVEFMLGLQLLSVTTPGRTHTAKVLLRLRIEYRTMTVTSHSSCLIVSSR